MPANLAGISATFLSLSSSVGLFLIVNWVSVSFEYATRVWSHL